MQWEFRTNSLLFYNHYDVVEEGKHELWSNEPFGPVIRDGVLYGRGVSDNKGPLLSRIQAVEAILAVEGKLPINVKFLFEGDEETSSPSLSKQTSACGKMGAAMKKEDHGRDSASGEV